MEFSNLTTTALLEACREDGQSTGNPEPVRDGINRPVGNDPHCWVSHPGDWISYHLPTETSVNTITLVLDSALDQNIVLSYHQQDDQRTSPPDRMPKTFRLEGLSNKEWIPLAYIANNYQRQVRLSVQRSLAAIRYVLDETWGDNTSQLFAFYLD